MKDSVYHNFRRMIILFYPGQRFIRVNREQVISSKNTGRNYLVCYIDNIKSAMADLSSSAFKCYLAFVMSRDQFILSYSPEMLSGITGIHKDTARKALKELIEKGYLVQYDDTHYNFYEYPRFVPKRNTEKEEVRTIIDQNTGEVFEYTYSQLRQFVNKELADILWKEAEIK